MKLNAFACNRLYLFLQLKELSHNNVKSFVGACVEPGHICYLTQYCSRGTVQASVLFSQISRTKPNRPDLTWPDLLKAGMRDILSASVFLIYLFLFFNDFCETNYLKVYWTDIRQIFRVGCMINIKLVFPSSRDVAMTAILLVLSQKWTSLDTGSYWHRRGGGCNVGLCRASSYWQFAFSFYAWLCWSWTGTRTFDCILLYFSYSYCF